MIRTATDDDSKALQALYAALHPNDPVAEPTAFASVLQSVLAGDGNEILLFEVDGVAVSTCYLNTIPNLTRGLRPYAVIENVVTLPEHRGKGYATALLHEAMTRAQQHGCYKVMLMTGSRRPSTLRFYENAGLLPGKKTAFVAQYP